MDSKIEGGCVFLGLGEGQYGSRVGDVVDGGEPKG